MLEEDLKIDIVVKLQTHFELNYKVEVISLEKYSDFINLMYPLLSIMGIDDLNILMGKVYLKVLKADDNSTTLTELTFDNWKDELENFFLDTKEYSIFNMAGVKCSILFVISEEEFSSEINRNISKDITNFYADLNDFCENLVHSIDKKCLVNNLSILLQCKDKFKESCEKYETLKNRISSMKKINPNIIFILRILYESIQEFQIKTMRMENALNRSKIINSIISM